MATRGTPPPDRDRRGSTALWIIGALILVVIILAVAGWAGGYWNGYWGEDAGVATIDEVEPEEDAVVE